MGVLTERYLYSPNDVAKGGQRSHGIKLGGSQQFLNVDFFLSGGGSFVLRTKCMREAADL